MKLWRILCAALFCACVNLPGQIAGLPEHNCLCESFISHKDIDRLKNDFECMGYFGDVGAPGTPSYVAVCTRGSKNYFLKFIELDNAAKKLRTASEAPVPQKTAEALQRYMKEAVSVSNESPVLLDRFLDDAVEMAVDAVADGHEVQVAGVMEHIEQAGVHSGDSACSLPPYSLPAVVVEEIKRQTKLMAEALNVVGLMNVQFAVQHAHSENPVIYVLEVNPRASRTVPFVSKATGNPVAAIAARVMAGQTLAEQGVNLEVTPRYVSVKEAVFPFSKFLGVDLATTRTGRVSITGLFEPVAIDGAMVSRAYLHNLDIFDAFQFGVGDEIMVYKANQIIPQIAENKTKSGTFKMPMACPCCGEKLIVRTTPGGSRQMYCENPYCAAKLIRKFTHFCEKTRMNIEGLSQTTLSKFLGHGWIRNFGDLYELEKYRDEFLQTPGFGEKSFERLLASIEKSRHCTLAKFIAGLGIPMVGRHAGRDLDRYFGGSWEAFEQAIQDGFDFTQLHDFGETMNNNIYIWYADAEEANLWRPLLNHIEFVKETSTMTTNTTNPFAGKTVVATGKLMNYTRDGI